MTNILHKKDDGTMHATGTLEKRSPGDQVVQVLIYAMIALIVAGIAIMGVFDL